MYNFLFTEAPPFTTPFENPPLCYYISVVIGCQASALHYVSSHSTIGLLKTR
jgi:hypothetical protein